MAIAVHLAEHQLSAPQLFYSISCVHLYLCHPYSTVLLIIFFQNQTPPKTLANKYLQ